MLLACEFGYSDSFQNMATALFTSSSPQPGPGGRCFPNGKAVIESLSFHEVSVDIHNDHVITSGDKDERS